ncbi:hypothetical protein Ssed_2560 [Shewanella sediminis HAW-EB3]|uniref:Uncharacterized protein n=1 Tax=Shewanella sediminis (strain HAW-EB3) TaxID=425104 RepID=A8FWE4_SHESH|nr:hypothetical protein [Shewanella sediminis]ABV37167.1 hypothetical protein Ssed_2560 [Shewanella sediminis HAW-EB3]
MTQEILSSIGLLLDLVGAIMIGFEVLKKYSGEKYQQAAGLGIDENGYIQNQSDVQPTADFAKWEKEREFYMKVGLFILATGFIIQIVANWV